MKDANNIQWSTLAHTVHGTLGQFPGFTHMGALKALQKGVSEDFGEVSTAHIQLCPQNSGVIDSEVVEKLQAQAPDTQFRLHANVNLGYDGSNIQDLSNARHNLGYYQLAGVVSEKLGSDVYSLHAGRRENYEGGAISGLEFIKELEDVMGCAVAVEGHYPTPDNKWMLSTWDEYRWLLESGLKYALDVSHLNIVAIKSNGADLGLTKALLESPNMIELHLSHNNGQSDAHVPMRGCNAPWWVPLLDSANPKAVAFTEGNEATKGRRVDRLNKGLNRKPRLLGGE